MKFIPTTATLVAKLRAEAKTLSKASGKTLTLAREEIAIKHGYHHWKHVTACADQTVANPPTRFERVGHLLTAKERVIFDKLSETEREFWLHQVEKATPEGRARFQPLSVSVTTGWKQAAKV